MICVNRVTFDIKSLPDGGESAHKCSTFRFLQYFVNWSWFKANQLFSLLMDGTIMEPLIFALLQKLIIPSRKNITKIDQKLVKNHASNSLKIRYEISKISSLPKKCRRDVDDGNRTKPGHQRIFIWSGNFINKLAVCLHTWRWRCRESCPGKRKHTLSMLSPKTNRVFMYLKKD